MFCLLATESDSRKKGKEGRGSEGKERERRDKYKKEKTNDINLMEVYGKVQKVRAKLTNQNCEKTGVEVRIAWELRMSRAHRAV